MISSGTTNKRTDVVVHYEGTIYRFVLLTEKARQWVEENTPDDRQMLGHNLIVEHRYAPGLAAGMKEAGLEVI